MSDLEKAREFFGGDLYATDATGIVIEECVGQNIIQKDLFQPDEIKIQRVVKKVGQLVIHQRGIDADDVDVVKR